MKNTDADKAAEAKYEKLLETVKISLSYRDFGVLNEYLKSVGQEKIASPQSSKEDIFPDSDMTVQEFYSGFNLDFLTEEERQTIYTATELYAKGKVRQDVCRAALEDLLEAIPKQTVDADWWEDSLTKAVEQAREALSGKQEDQEALWTKIILDAEDYFVKGIITRREFIEKQKSKFSITTK